MEYYTEEEKEICRRKVFTKGCEMLREQHNLSEFETNYISEEFYNELISSPKSLFSLPNTIMASKSAPIMALVFTDILGSNRYEIWLTEDKFNIEQHPMAVGGKFVECSKSFSTIEDAVNSAINHIESYEFVN